MSPRLKHLLKLNRKSMRDGDRLYYAIRRELDRVVIRRAGKENAK